MKHFLQKLNPDMIYQSRTYQYVKFFYPEDEIRAKFYKKYGNQGVINFDENNDIQTPCQKFLNIYMKLKTETKLTDDELMNETGKIYENMQLELEAEQLKEKANTLVVPKLSDLFKKGLEEKIDKD